MMLGKLHTSHELLLCLKKASCYPQISTKAKAGIAIAIGTSYYCVPRKQAFILNIFLRQHKRSKRLNCQALRKHSSSISFTGVAQQMMRGLRDMVLLQLQDMGYFELSNGSP